MSVKTRAVRKLIQPVPQPVRAARRVVPLEKHMRLRVRRLPVRAPQLQTPRHQRLRPIQIVHLMVREGVPREKPPVLPESRRQPVELLQHPLPLLHPAVVEIAAQPLQHDRRVARRLRQMLINPARRLRAAPHNRRAENRRVPPLPLARPRRQPLRLPRVLPRRLRLAPKQIKQRQLAARQRKARIRRDRRLQRRLHARQIAQHPLHPRAVLLRRLFRGRQRVPPAIDRHRSCSPQTRAPAASSTAMISPLIKPESAASATTAAPTSAGSISARDGSIRASAADRCGSSPNPRCPS